MEAGDNDARYSALVIANSDIFPIWAATLEAIANVRIVKGEPSSFDNLGILLKTLEEEYNYIIIPSTLPKFASLRLAELSIKLESITKVILVSKTEGNKDLLRELFDGYIPSEHFSAAALRKALGTQKERPDPERVPSLIEELLASEYVFQNLYAKEVLGGWNPTHHPLIPTYRDYLRVMEKQRMPRVQPPKIPKRAEHRTAAQPQNYMPHRLLMVLSVGAFIVGMSFAIIGLFVVAGSTKIDMFGQTIDSTSAGVTAIFIGAMLVILTTRRVLNTLDRMINPNA